MKADEKAAAKLDKALRKLHKNPVALLLVEGDADAGHLLEAVEAVTFMSCVEAKALQSRKLTKAAKILWKDWNRFRSSLRALSSSMKALVPSEEEGGGDAEVPDER